MAAETKSVNLNLGLASPLFLVFLVLKLTGVIGWSWWWVTAPLWGPMAFVLVLVLIGAFIVAVTR